MKCTQGLLTALVFLLASFESSLNAMPLLCIDEKAVGFSKDRSYEPTEFEVGDKFIIRSTRPGEKDINGDLVTFPFVWYAFNVEVISNLTNGCEFNNPRTAVLCKNVIGSIIAVDLRSQRFERYDGGGYVFQDDPIRKEYSMNSTSLTIGQCTTVK